MHDKEVIRDIIFIDRTLFDLGFPERIYLMEKVTLEQAQKIYVDESRALTRYFQDPAYADGIIIMLFHLMKGLSLERRMIWADPKQRSKIKYRVWRLYHGLKIQTCYRNLLKEAVLTDTEHFLEKIERANAIGHLVLKKMRNKGKKS